MCVENVEIRSIFVEIDYCQFTWIVFSPCLYPLNRKLKKLLIGGIEAMYIIKICNHRGEKARRFDGKQRLHNHHCFMT